MDIATINEAAVFLASLIEYEESDYLRNEAKNALFDLQDHFSRIKSDADDEKAGILKSVIDGL
jgi:hypothetical protein